MGERKDKIEKLNNKFERLAIERQGSVESKVRRFVELLTKERPDLTNAAVNRIISTSIHYAREILKGKSAELYGLSLDFGILTMTDPNTPRKEKMAIALKVLGHMLPTEVKLTGDDEGKPILFQMQRPEGEEQPEEQVQNVYDAAPEEPQRAWNEPKKARFDLRD